jgi:hypothetical protein
MQKTPLLPTQKRGQIIQCWMIWWLLDVNWPTLTYYPSTRLGTVRTKMKNHSEVANLHARYDSGTSIWTRCLIVPCNTQNPVAHFIWNCLALITQYRTFVWCCPPLPMFHFWSSCSTIVNRRYSAKTIHVVSLLPYRMHYADPQWWITETWSREHIQTTVIICNFTYQQV